MTSLQAPIVNRLGLHARAAARFVQLASRYQASVRVSLGPNTMDGKSILGLLLLGAAQGSVITIAADGIDEREALAALIALVERGFEDA